MARFLKSSKESIGQSPFDLQFSGEKKSDKVRWRWIQYNKDELREEELENVREYKELLNDGMVNWLNIDGLHEVDSLAEVGELIENGRHMMAKVLEIHARPKLITYDEAILITVKMLQYQEVEETVASENLSLIISKGQLLTFQEREGDLFESVRDRLRKNRKVIRESGPEYLAYAILDVVVDNYIHIISRIGERIEDLDEELIADPSDDKLERINDLKAEVNYLRKAVIPCREIVFSLNKTDNGLIGKKMGIHLSELGSNVDLAIDSANNYREILSDQMNIYHTIMSQKLNDILKTLTIFSVIFIPITFIVGIYGTNFDFIPELHWHYGYFIMWLVILALALFMLGYFKYKKWF